MGTGNVVFLMYHELESEGRPLCRVEPGYVRYILPVSNFRAQMDSLRKGGFLGVSVGVAVAGFATGTVAITFDDGCETDLLFAAPILREFGFGATFYITTGWSGTRGYLSHSQIRELSGAGFEIGCHSMNHLYLTDLDQKSLHCEIVESKSALEQVVGKRVEHFSCPGGRHNRLVSEVAEQAGYRTVATSEIRANSQQTNRFALGRVALLRSTPIREFSDICAGQGLWRKRVAVQAREIAKKTFGNSVYDRLRERLLKQQKHS